MKSGNQCGAQLSILLWSELYFLALFLVAVKGRFKGVNVNKFIGMAQINSGCFSLLLLCGKGTVHILNTGMQLATNIRKYFDDLWTLRVRITIKKAVQPI